MMTATSYNRAYLATVLRTSAKIPRFARNFRYAQPLYEIPNSPSQTKVNLNHQRKRGLASFNQKTRGKNMNQIATQPGITEVKPLRRAKTQIFNNRSEGELRTIKTLQINIFNNIEDTM